MGIEKTYFDLTGVDIKRQQEMWDERGKGYFGEFLVFRELFEFVPYTSKFLMNLQLPVDSEKTTEVDMLLIHDTGIYVFEIKHYKGTIYGKEDEEKWVQYFRTAKNNSFRNPVKQNEYHINVLKKLYPNVPVFSVVVFTNSESVLRINRNQSSAICKLTNLKKEIGYTLFSAPKTLDEDKIDSIFKELEKYSPLDKNTVIQEEKVVSLNEYISILKIEKDKAVEKAEKEEKATRKILVVTISLILAILLTASVVFALIYKKVCDDRVAQTVSQLDEMKQKFSEVDISQRDNTELLNNMIEVSEISFKKSQNLSNTLIFTCSLTNNDKEYGAQINENTTYIIKMKDGSVREYPMFNNEFKFNSFANRLDPGKKGQLRGVEVYNITSSNQIEFIKITNISLRNTKNDFGRIFVNGLELELYKSTD